MFFKIDYTLEHSSEDNPNIELTFQIRPEGINNIKHNAFTFDSNYYSFDDTNSNFVLNNLRFERARRYQGDNWDTELDNTTDETVYGVSVTPKSTWSLSGGKAVESLMDVNSNLNDDMVFNSVELQEAYGLKVKEDVTTLEGYQR